MLDTSILIYLIKNKPESVTQRVIQAGHRAGLTVETWA
jgi:predicted nucleic acid-binding protein